MQTQVWPEFRKHFATPSVTGGGSADEQEQPAHALPARLALVQERAEAFLALLARAALGARDDVFEK